MPNLKKDILEEFDDKFGSFQIWVREEVGFDEDDFKNFLLTSIERIIEMAEKINDNLDELCDNFDMEEGVCGECDACKRNKTRSEFLSNFKQRVE